MQTICSFQEMVSLLTISTRPPPHSPPSLPPSQSPLSLLTLSLPPPSPTSSGTSRCFINLLSSTSSTVFRLLPSDLIPFPSCPPCSVHFLLQSWQLLLRCLCNLNWTPLLSRCCCSNSPSIQTFATRRSGAASAIAFSSWLLCPDFPSHVFVSPSAPQCLSTPHQSADDCFQRALVSPAPHATTCNPGHLAANPTPSKSSRVTCTHFGTGTWSSVSSFAL